MIYWKSIKLAKGNIRKRFKFKKNFVKDFNFDKVQKNTTWQYS
jgi:hypothetical protein